MWKVLLMLLSFVLGGAIGAVSFSTAPSFSFQSDREVKQSVESYLRAETNGRQAEALEFLSGEAKVIVSSQPTPLPDPLVKDELQVVVQTNDVAQVKATIWTQKNRMEQQFFLTKQNGKWFINRVTAAPKSWAGMKPVQLETGQQAVIRDYVASIARGDVEKANQLLVGNAAIQAGKWASKRIPQQSIEITDVRAIGVLPTNEVLIEVSETIHGSVNQNERVLFTLTPLADHSWKISDVQLLERSMTP